jgi:signal transduction histidine kinase
VTNSSEASDGEPAVGRGAGTHTGVPSNPIGFTVDTHLLRELGELLVTRDSTAVMELVKNAYDADARQVIIHAQSLGTRQATMSVVDDGNGMTLDRFYEAYLRIAGRSKEGADRFSPRFRRRYTGEKGIGRLASHKLASHIAVTSHPLVDPDLEEHPTGVVANFDWDVIEEQDSLESLSRGLDVRGSSGPTGTHGTTLVLTRLRGSWTDSQRHDFVQEVRSSSPPQYLSDEWAQVLTGQVPLIERPRVREHGPRDRGFNIVWSGDLDEGDELWQQATGEFTWLLEIDAYGDEIRYRVTPTLRQIEKEPLSRTYDFVSHPTSRVIPKFQARIYIRPNASVRVGPLAKYTRENSGVRVYLEGFRVMPFGGRGDDWLGLAQDYRFGARSYGDLRVTSLQDELPEDRKEALTAVTNYAHYGAVLLTGGGLRGLRSLVNREGFVEDESYEKFQAAVSTGVRLVTRVRRSVLNARADADRRTAIDAAMSAGNSSEAGESETIPAGDPQGGDVDDPQQQQLDEDDLVDDVGDDDWDQERPPGYGAAPRHWTLAISTAVGALRELRTSASPSASPSTIAAIATGFDASIALLDQLRDEQANLRVLAGVGLQLGAFVHDINGLLGQVQTLRELVDLLVEGAPDPRTRQRANRVRGSLDDLAHGLVRQSAYLTDVVGPDPRRRRSRTPVARRLEVAARLVAGRVAQARITLETVLDAALKTPPMFPSEISIVLTNLLTNAVKNAGVGGRVRVSAVSEGRRGVRIRVSNTGTRVDLADSERWFRAFETTTTDVDEVLGQGLGLGLTIVRSIVEDYGGEVRFVAPEDDYSTTVEVVLPDRLDAALRGRQARG